MEYRELAGLTVSAVGLGCLAMTGGYGPADPDECVTTIRKGLDLGLTLLDTADFYPGSERLVGRAIAGRRDEVVVATRGGMRSAAPGGPPKIFDGTPDHLRGACTASLRALDVDHIDLYYLARVDPRVPVEESTGALAELVEEGKIRHIGLSEATAGQLRAAHAVHPITALESEYSLWERHVEAEILPAARALGIGFVAHTPLGKGMLTGELPAGFGPRDFRSNHPRFQGENLRHNRELVAGAARALGRTGRPLGQLALAWVLAQGKDVVAIPGTRDPDHLAANLAAADIVLTPELLAQLAESVPPDGVSGDRVPQRS